MLVKELPKAQQLTPIWLQYTPFGDGVSIEQPITAQFKQVVSRHQSGEPRTVMLQGPNSLSYMTYDKYLECQVVENIISLEADSDYHDMQRALKDPFLSHDGTNSHFAEKP